MVDKHNQNRSSGRWIVASNRLPFRWNSQTEQLEQSSGGLITAISGIHSASEITWIGVAPEGITETQWNSIPALNQEKRYLPLFMPDKTYELYYNGMCNTCLWPLLHYESSRVQFSRDVWDAYVAVNQMFAETILKTATEDDLIWIHDFHLFMVSKFLHEANERLKVGFFLHTPFPSFEVFGQISVREEILRSLLMSDLVGFHDYSYLRHFCNSVSQYLGQQADIHSIQVEGRQVQLGVFPVSIDTPHFKNEAFKPEVQQLVKRLRKRSRQKYLVLGVDRLDYIKGLKLKLRGFRNLLVRHPELRGEVVLMQIAVPTRTDVPGYIELKRGVEQLVGEINGTFGKPDYTPVQYIFSSVSFHELLALYRIADVLLVTSRRDGMNLVALEYLAAQPPKDPGVVVLSEFTGAMSALSQVIKTNPWDAEQTAEKIFQALTMDQEERIMRYNQMISYLDRYTATSWAESFTSALVNATSSRSVIKGVLIGEAQHDSEAWKALLSEVNHKKRLLIFLDYDGTLVQLRVHPDDAVLSQHDFDTLATLSNDSRLELVIVSGRTRNFIGRQFRSLRIDIAAEHGARFYDAETNKWSNLVHHRTEAWLSAARQILRDYSFRVPGSFVEEKRFALAWHYRSSPEDFAETQARKLRNELESALANRPVTVLTGKKVVEVRAIEANKGTFLDWFLDSREQNGKLNHVLAIGDDETDEEMFSVLESHGGIAVKVGRESTRARYRLRRSGDVLPFILRLLDTLHPKSS